MVKVIILDIYEESRVFFDKCKDLYVIYSIPKYNGTFQQKDSNIILLHLLLNNIFENEAENKPS